MCKEGRIEAGTVLVIEAWDRLSRERPDKTIKLLSKLLEAGLSIGVCRLDDIFTEEDFGTHKFTTLAVFIQLAHQESKQKSERVAASWQRRRELARSEGRMMTTTLPAWLECKAEEVRPIPERAAVVKRIFDLAGRGYGHTRIVKALTEEGIRPFGEHRISEGRKRSHFSGRWTRQYVDEILSDKRATGFFQPRTIDGNPEGPPIPDYLPAIVSESEFLLARAGAAKRRTKNGPRQRKYLNLFAGLLVHARDGGGFILHNKGTGARVELLLVNATGREGLSRNYTFPYASFEKAILRRLREVKPEEIAPVASTSEPNRVEVLKAKLANVAQEIEGLTEDLRQGYSPALTAVLREKEAQQKSIKEELEREQAAALCPPDRDWTAFRDLAAALESAEDPEDARIRLQSVLRRTIQSISLLITGRGAIRLAVAQVWFVSGSMREYRVYHRPPKWTGVRRKPGSWCVESVKYAADDLDNRSDLRKQEDVEALLERLEGDGDHWRRIDAVFPGPNTEEIP
jgi:hypothetical protein